MEDFHPPCAGLLNQGLGRTQGFLWEEFCYLCLTPFTSSQKPKTNPDSSIKYCTSPYIRFPALKGIPWYLWLWEISLSWSSSHRISTQFINTHWILISYISLGNFRCKGVLCTFFEPKLSHGIGLVT